MTYTLEALQQEYKNGRIFDFLLFYGHTHRDSYVNQSCLSQWWMQNFNIDGITYSCAEQYMMAQKAHLFNDAEALCVIMDSKSPKDIKAIGRRVRNFDSDIWNDKCFEIVLRASYAKFKQNPALRAYLMSTGNQILVEASPYDNVWGIGLTKDHPDALNPLKWRGQNLLGFALTQSRDMLRFTEA